MNALAPPSDAEQRRGGGMPPTLSGIHSDPRTGPAACTYFGVIVNIPAIYWLASGAMGHVPDVRRTDENRIVGAVAPALFRPGGSVLADDLREPGRPVPTLPGACRVGWPVEVPEGLDEGVVV